MKFKLLLTGRAYPESLLRIETPDEILEEDRKSWVEQKILDAINSRNQKLKLNCIEYCNICERFSEFFDSNYAGLIVEETEIAEEARENYTARNFYVYEEDGKILAQRPWIYTMMTSPIEEGRNVFISQSIFPTLIEYMEKFITSPSYEISNHPVYFINIVNKQITAESIIKPLHALALMKICYIDVFNSTPSVDAKTLSLKEYIRRFDAANFNEESQQYSSSTCDIDFQNKTFCVRTDTLVLGQCLTRNGQYIDFNGSSEKFYWMDMLPVVMKAFEENFHVDYENLKVFCERRNEFSPRSSKFSRFETILNYIKKLNLEA